MNITQYCNNYLKNKENININNQHKNISKSSSQSSLLLTKNFSNYGSKENQKDFKNDLKKELSQFQEQNFREIIREQEKKQNPLLEQTINKSIQLETYRDQKDLIEMTSFFEVNDCNLYDLQQKFQDKLNNLQQNLNNISSLIASNESSYNERDQQIIYFQSMITLCERILFLIEMNIQQQDKIKQQDDHHLQLLQEKQENYEEEINNLKYITKFLRDQKDQDEILIEELKQQLKEQQNEFEEEINSLKYITKFLRDQKNQDEIIIEQLKKQQKLIQQQQEEDKNKYEKFQEENLKIQEQQQKNIEQQQEKLQEYVLQRQIIESKLNEKENQLNLLMNRFNIQHREKQNPDKNLLHTSTYSQESSIISYFDNKKISREFSKSIDLLKNIDNKQNFNQTSTIINNQNDQNQMKRSTSRSRSSKRIFNDSKDERIPQKLSFIGDQNKSFQNHNEYFNQI